MSSFPATYAVEFSFTLTYILLLTTGTITFIEALCTKNPAVRHIMNLETCISIIAGYFYSLFVAQIKHSSSSSESQDKKQLDFQKITRTRYTDWCITTPMMLLCLCVVLGMHTNTLVTLQTYIVIVLLNYTMLLIGYLGEIGALPKLSAVILGFIPFFLMFGYIYSTFVMPKYVPANYFLYGFYLFVWSLYGVVYLWEPISKNVALNILDCISKCLIGLGLWAYYTKIIVGGFV